MRKTSIGLLDVITDRFHKSDRLWNIFLRKTWRILWRKSCLGYQSVKSGIILRILPSFDLIKTDNIGITLF